MKRFFNCLVIACLALPLSSCLMGKDYKRPATANPASFKELGEWKKAEPKDTAIKAKWWEVFKDNELNNLEEQIVISNQNIKAAEAAYRQAKALADETWAGFFPVITADGGVTRNKSTVQNNATRYNAALNASSWEIDLWGRIRRNSEAAFATASASEADLGAATLSAQADLLVNYLSLRIADEQKRLLASTVANYRRSLTLTQNLYNAGVGPRSDLLQAQTQLESAQAQLIDVDVNRAKLEHAIAILIGKAPANFSLAALPTVPDLPYIPVSVPSALLEQRPDVAASERRIIAANASVGAAKAAFFPQLLLSASGGYESNSFSQLFSLPNRVWSIGPSLVQPLFDAGLRRAQSRAAIAVYDQAVANYRQSVLTAFGEVEDNLATLTILAKEAVLQRNTVQDAGATSTIFLNQYKAGLINYLSVVTAQNTEFTNRLTELGILRQRLVAAAGLIKALGGGWQTEAIQK